MRILIVTQYFWPENFRINDLASAMVERGHDVTVFTGVPNYPEGKFFSGYGWFRKSKEYYRGVNIIRYPLIPRGRGKGWELLLNYASSALLSSLWAPFVLRGKFDLIFVNQLSPVTTALPAVLLKRIKSIPIILWVLDLWPESLTATGAVRSARVVALVRSLVRFIYRRADRLLVSSQGFKSGIVETGGYAGQIIYFPNWVEPEYLVEQQTGENLPTLPDGFKVMFAGNIGAAQDFESLLAAAGILKSYVDIQWVIIGDGRRFDWVKEQVRERGLQDQFHLLGRYSAETMPGFFRQADAMLVSLKDTPIFSLTAPGKLQSYMSCGKPIIASLAGEGARLVEESGAGVACLPERPEMLAECVLGLYRMSPEDRKKMGELGLAFCRQHFNRDRHFDLLESLMDDLVPGGRA